MLILIIVLIEIYCLYRFIFNWFLIFCFLFYILWYFDRSENNGRRTWDSLKNLAIWKFFSPIKYYNFEETELLDLKKRLFIVIPNRTYLSLIWGFGFNSAQLHHKLDVCYILPRILFYIPIVRDILLWSGAVADSPPHLSTTETIITLLNQGRSVCYSPLTIDRKTNKIPIPDNNLFEFCKEKNINVIPVVVSNEIERYWFPFNLISLQKRCYAWCGYPFPQLFFLKIFSQSPPNKIDLQFGTPINCGAFANTDIIKEKFIQVCESINNNGVDKPLSFE